MRPKDYRPDNNSSKFAWNRTCQHISPPSPVLWKAWRFHTSLGAWSSYRTGLSRCTHKALGRGSVTDAPWRWGRARGCDDAPVCRLFTHTWNHSLDVGKDPMWKAGFMGSTLKQGWNWPVVLTGIIFVSKFMSIVIRSTIPRHFIALLHLFWDVQYFKTSFPLHEWSN